MTEEKINELDECLKAHICKLSRASKDDQNNVKMCESGLEVVWFDKIPAEYGKRTGCPKLPKSNDALYVANSDEWYFIEFKNGGIEKSDIFRKIYDSIIMLLELKIIPDFQFVRENVNYILVYNSENYTTPQYSEALKENYAYIQQRAKTEKKLFEVEKLETYLLKETHTYDKETFKQKFIIPMERQESNAVY